VEYASWRVLHLVIGILGLVVFGIMWFYFPETSHPGARGIDKLRLKAESGARIRWTNYVVNPFAPLGLLRAPNVLVVTMACFAVLLTWFVLMVPLAYTVGVKYNIKNVVLLGACVIPTGIGEIFGAPFSGRLSDRIVVQSRRSRGGTWYPEDRLRAALGGALVLVPLTMILSGIITEYVEGPIGLVLDLACFFLNGFGLQMVLGPAAAYLVDVLHSRSTEAVAVNNGFRSTVISFAISGIIPMLDAYGVMVTNTASAVVAWLGCGLFWLTIQRGESMRAWCDVGFSTAEDN